MAEPIEDGDAVRSTGAVVEPEITARVLALVRKLASDPAGGGSAGMRAVDNLQGYAEREAYLREMVMNFRPPQADPELWLRWLSGGPEPFAPRVPEKPHVSQVNTKREIERASKRVTAARDRIAKAERELSAAQSVAASALEFESSLIAWALMEQITSLVTPVFAMGPAWTLMRVVSPHVPADEMENELILEDHEPSRKALEQKVREERVELSKKLHAALDFWAGDRKFEVDLRNAIKSVVDKHQPREAAARAKGRKLRSQNEAKNSVRPDSAAARHEILGRSEHLE